MSDFEAGATSVIAQPGGARIAGVELCVVEGPDAGKRLRIDKGSARIGTGRGNELVLGDRTVSRVHCEVVVRPEGVALRDSGSTNGTFLEGHRVRDVDLGHGASIRIGQTVLQVEIGGEAAFLPLSERDSFGEVLGKSQAMRHVFALLERAASTDSTVLVLGETGTGKELVAQAVHERSPRAPKPFVTVDCGAMPENLMESELFGHVRGAFTGAVSERRGAFEEADGGTIFFDEIGELPLTLQPKLLRALESRQVRRVGSNQSRRVDVRVVAATNRSLARCVNEGSFREDLYYRLAVVEVELPPLRARREDIPELAVHFLARFASAPATVPPELLSALMARSWPGNVRELRNFIERSISVGWHPAAEPPRGDEPLRADAQPSGPLLGGELAADLERLFRRPFKDARIHWTQQFEGIYVRALLARTGGNVTRAAELAGISRRFLQRTMVRLGMRTGDWEP
jgi:transcriptional regulator with PAS, ATPase and Fis domain